MRQLMIRLRNSVDVDDPDDVLNLPDEKLTKANKS